MLEQLSGIIIHVIQSTGYFGVFILMLFNASAIPFPSEITLPFAGFLSFKGDLFLPMVIFAGILGDMIGSVIAYTIGYLLEENLLLSLIRKYGKFILLTEHDYHKATGWIDKYGSPVVFIGKSLPGFKSFISLAAGISEVKFSKFIISAALGSILYVTVVSYIGYYLGSQWDILGGYFRKFEIVILIFLVLGVLFYINYKLKIVKFPKRKQ